MNDSNMGCGFGNPLVTATEATISSALVSTTQRDIAAIEAEIDAHGLNPADYHWVPMLRKRRSDGWSVEKMRDFIATLADTGSVSEAAKAASMSAKSCYRLRREPGAENFAHAWNAAIQHASLRLTDVAFDRALNGVADPVKYDQYGDPLEPRRRYNDRLLMFLLRAHQPERYRFANRDVRTADEPAPPPATSLPEAIARLEPEMPDKPHLLTHHDDPVCAMQVAEIAPGELPPYYQDTCGDWLPGPDDYDYDLERQLAQAKRDNANPRADLANYGDSLV